MVPAVQASVVDSADPADKPLWVSEQERKDTCHGGPDAAFAGSAPSVIPAAAAAAASAMPPLRIRIMDDKIRQGGLFKTSTIRRFSCHLLRD